jgi:hypothetical protein
MAAPGGKGRWSTGALEAKHEQKQEQKQHASGGGGSLQVWLPSGPGHASTPRRPPAGIPAASPAPLAGRRHSGIMRRSTTESVISARNDSDLSSPPRELDLGRAAPAAEIAGPSAEASPLGTPSAVQIDCISGTSLVEFWTVLQHTQRNLNDVLVSDSFFQIPLCKPPATPTLNCTPPQPRCRWTWTLPAWSWT